MPVDIAGVSSLIPTFGPESATDLMPMATAAIGAVAGGAHGMSFSSTVFSPTARLPRKLAAKIQSLEFIEISELLPEAWIPEYDNISVHARRPPRRTPVSDVLVWTECFSLMAAVLAEKFPTKSSQLFAYMRRVVHAARNFRGTAWVAYDRLYRRQAAARRSLDWAVEDAALYNEAFVGQAKVIPRCRHCLSEYHSTETCPDFVNLQWTNQPAIQTSTSRTYLPIAGNPVQEICRRYNENRCTYPACKYRHACLNCGLSHPVTACSSSPISQRPAPRGRDRSPRDRGHPTRPLGRKS